MVQAKHADHQRRQHHGDQCGGQARETAGYPDQQCQTGQTDAQRYPVDFPQTLQQVDQAEDETITFNLEPQHFTQLTGQQAQTDAVEVTDQNRTREKTGNKAGAGQPGTDQHQAHQEGDNHRQLRQSCGIPHRQRGNGPCHHGAGGRIWADHQLARTAHQGINHHGQNARI
ncbi:hypothetical protein D3C78_1173820 [compost metagenome]